MATRGSQRPPIPDGSECKREVACVAFTRQTEIVSFLPS